MEGSPATKTFINDQDGMEYRLYIMNFPIEIIVLYI